MLPDAFFLDGVKFQLATATAPARPALYVVLHDLFLPRGVRLPPVGLKGCPEVFRFDGGSAIRLNEAMQRLWKDINPGMTGMEWRKLLYDDYAFCNRQGFEHGFNNGPKRDYVNNLDTDAPELPAMDAIRICGGNVLSGEVRDGWLYPEYIDTTKPLPTAEYVLACPWLSFIVTNVYYPSGSVGGVPASLTAEERVPLYANAPIRFPLASYDRGLVRLADNAPIPSPYLER